LPTFYASLCRIQGEYAKAYDGWSLYGDYMPYSRRVAETRGQPLAAIWQSGMDY